jgi:hypothetical protein
LIAEEAKTNKKRPLAGLFVYGTRKATLRVSFPGLSFFGHGFKRNAE